MRRMPALLPCGTPRSRARHRIMAQVKAAVRDGLFEKPQWCTECGGDGRIEAHHDDYRHPLKVRWLCRSCHRQWHEKNGPGAGLEEAAWAYAERKRAAQSGVDLPPAFLSATARESEAAA